MVMEILNYKNLKTGLHRYGHGEPQPQELKTGLHGYGHGEPQPQELKDWPPQIWSWRTSTTRT